MGDISPCDKAGKTGKQNMSSGQGHPTTAVGLGEGIMNISKRGHDREIAGAVLPVGRGDKARVDKADFGARLFIRSNWEQVRQAKAGRISPPLGVQ